MGVAASLVVVAIGAILRFAVTAQTSSFDIHVVGVILMALGAVGFVVSVVYWATGGWPGFGYRTRRVYDDAGYRGPAQDGRRVVEESERRY